MGKTVCTAGTLQLGLILLFSPLSAGSSGENPTVTVKGQVEPVTTGAAEGYVPDRACSMCHREIYLSFRHVGMARSFYRPSSDNVIEDYANNDFYHEASDRHYEMLRRDDGFFLRRYRIDAEGERYAEIEQRIDWIIGSGNHARSYLHQTELGELYQLPVVWYTAKPGWGMAPGYDRPDHAGFTRRIDRECMFCHNAYPDVLVGSDAAHEPHLFPPELPEGVGCQRCHGPGAEHIRRMEAGSTMRSVREAIVNPAKLDPELRDDVCFQCHLQPVSSHASLIRRLGRSDYSYRPGQPLEDYLLHMEFDEGSDPGERFEVNHHPYRLRQSRCFRESGGKLNCLTCHDPHVKVPEAERAAHYRSRCLTCHEIDACSRDGMQPESSMAHTGDCVSCHMPRRRPHDAINVVMTDHLIRRSPPEEEWLEISPDFEKPRPFEEVTYYFPERAPAEPLRSSYRTIAAVTSGKPDRVDVLRSAVQAAGEDSAELAMIIGNGQLRAGRFADAAATFEELIRDHPGYQRAYLSAATALVSAGEPEQALPILEKVKEKLAEDPALHYDLGLAHAAAKRYEPAIEHLEEAARLRPNDASAHRELGRIYLEREQFERASRHFGRAIALDPASGENYWDLGRARYALRDWSGAIAAWRRGVSLRPEIAEFLVLLYLTCPDAELRDEAKALAVARLGADRQRDDAKLHVALAMTLLLNNKMIEALEAVEQAREGGAEPATCLLIKAAAERGLGRPEAPATYREALRAAPESQANAFQPLARAVAKGLFE